MTNQTKKYKVETSFKDTFKTEWKLFRTYKEARLFFNLLTVTDEIINIAICENRNPLIVKGV